MKKKWLLSLLLALPLAAVVGLLAHFFWKGGVRLKLDRIDTVTEYERLTGLRLREVASDFSGYALEGRERYYFARFNLAPAALLGFLTDSGLPLPAMNESEAMRETRMELVCQQNRVLETVMDQTRRGSPAGVKGWMPKNFMPRQAGTAGYHSWVAGITNVSQTNLLVFHTTVSHSFLSPKKRQ